MCTSACTWGACELGVVDGYEENDTEATARALPGISDADGEATYLVANVNPSFDDDWFTVHVQDEPILYSINPWATLSAVPVGETYRFCVGFVCDQNGTAPTTRCYDVVGGSSRRVELDVSGCDDYCGLFCFDNGGTMVIQVDPQTAGSCTSYRVDYGG